MKSRRAVIAAVLIAVVPVCAVSVEVSAAHASAIGGGVSRPEVLKRVQNWVDRGVQYNLNVRSNTLVTDIDGEHRYRPDCSGLVSMAWHLDPGSVGGFNVRGFAAFTGKTYLVSPYQLQPGDAIIKSGHIELFARWKDPDDVTRGAYTYSLNGGPDPNGDGWEEDWAKGPVENSHGQIGTESWRSIQDNYAWIRYNNITSGSDEHGTVSHDSDANGQDDLALLYGNGSGYASVEMFTSTGTRMVHTKVWKVKAGYYLGRVGDRVIAGDFNGDGKADLATAYKYGSGAARVHVWLNGSAYQGPSGWWSTTTGFDLNRVNGRMVAGDFNGDGKDDIAMVYGSGSGYASVEMFTSTGTRMVHTKVWNVKAGYHLGRVGDRVIAGDFNGDGKADLAAAYKYGSAAARVHVWLNGSAYQGPSGWWSTTTGFDLNRVNGRMS